MNTGINWVNDGFSLCATTPELNFKTLPPKHDATVVHTQSTPGGDAFADYVNPHLAKMLKALKLDKCFIRGQGSRLYDANGRGYLDCISAYGALPFGFNPEEIWVALMQVRAAGEPSLVQPSMLNAAGLLAQRLIELAPGDLRYVTFANSGTEAVEAAIKMCRISTGRTRIITTHNSFHGKTLGALAATGNANYQDGFAAPTEQFSYVRYGDSDAIQELLTQQPNQFAAVILEPIQGEGGIIEPPAGYLTTVRRLCDKAGVLLIFDEIQTGLGRTGKLFACEEEGVAPDVMTLAKALGGGLMPIGAVLANERAYSSDFALKHSSTFAGNALACRAGLAALERITRDDGELINQVRENGERLKAGLEELQSRYPHLLCKIHGRGYMLGLVFGVIRQTFLESLLGVAAEQSLLTPLFASYLLNVEGVRVAPTLNGKAVIRIEPPLTFSWSECEELLGALDRALAAFSDGHTGQVFSSILAERSIQMPLPEGPRKNPVATFSKRGERRFAFLMHALDLNSIADFDPFLEGVSSTVLQEIVDRMQDIIEPFVLSTTRVTSATGESIYGEFIVVPRTAKQLAEMPKKQACAAVQDAVDLACRRGAQMIGLGAFTSVVTGGGRTIRSPHVPLTTGNSYTTVACSQGITLAMNRLGRSVDRTTSAAIVGATGAIGRAMGLLLAENVGRLILIGNPESDTYQVRRRLMNVGTAVCRQLLQQAELGREYEPDSLGDSLIRAVRELPDGPIEDRQLHAIIEQLDLDDRLVLTQDVGVVNTCSVVVTATSAVGALIGVDDLQRDAVVCDLSRPANVSRSVANARRDVLVIDGGLIAVPGTPDLGRIGLDRGQAYSCMAETMLLTLAGHFENTGLGTDLKSESLNLVRDLANRHGFQLAQLKSFGHALAEADWERLKTTSDVV